MSGTVNKIREKLTRRYSHKNPEIVADLVIVNFDDAESADEETNEMVNKEYTSAENDDNNPYGKPGSLLNRMILHGNKKTEEQLAAEQAGNTQTTTATQVTDKA